MPRSTPKRLLDPALLSLFPLSSAQLVVARRHGFANWARLKSHVEVVLNYSRFPSRMSAAGPVDLADQFLRLACLGYDGGGPGQWAEARAFLAEHPEISREGARTGGSCCFASHSLALGRLLLEAGADPNDGQALYNRMFEPDNDHLELLFEFGLGTGDGGLWRKRLGSAVQAPAEMVRGQLAWALTHGMAERVSLLADHGVDIVAPFDDGLSPASLAATTGHPDLVENLVGRGAARPALTPDEAFVAAVLGGDRAAVEQLSHQNAGLVDLAPARPGGLSRRHRPSVRSPSSGRTGL